MEYIKKTLLLNQQLEERIISLMCMVGRGVPGWVLVGKNKVIKKGEGFFLETEMNVSCSFCTGKSG